MGVVDEEEGGGRKCDGMHALSVGRRLWMGVRSRLVVYLYTNTKSVTRSNGRRVKNVPKCRYF